MRDEHPNRGTIVASPPIVGRSAERVLLREQLSSMVAGNGNVVIIGGEAGIGKTAIARDLADQARRDGARVLSGHCHDLMATPPYGIWLDLAVGYQRSPNRSALPSLPDALVSRNLDRVSSQLTLFEDVTGFFLSLAQLQPIVIVLEDVHWADPASLELLRYLAVRIGHVPAMIMVTYRIDELTRRNPFYQQLPALVRESEGLRIDLKSLESAELDSLVALHYTLPPEDRHRLVDYLATYAEGNPFFALELLRSLEEQGDGGLLRTESGWQLGDIEHVRVPPLVRQVIDARVARLGESVREPLTVASVIGHDVPIDLLASVAGTEAGTLFDAIDTAIEWHLCTESDDGSKIHFVHALTREALYASILPQRRRQLHQQVAALLEVRSDFAADTIAYHYQQALDPRAPDWLTKAGDRAQRAYAWLTAKERFAAAAKMLESVPGKEATRARLLYRCGRLQRYSNAPNAIECLRNAARLAAVAGDHMLAADATYSQGLVQCFADDWTNGVPAMIAGIEALRCLPAKDTAITSADATWMADALPAMGSWTSLPPSASGHDNIAIDVNRHMSLAWFLAESGHLDEGLKIAESYLQDTPEEGAGPLVIANLGHAAFGAGIANASQGDVNGAHNAHERARHAYRSIDHHACLAYSLLNELVDVAVPYFTDNIPLRTHLADDAATEIDQSRGAFASSVSPALAQLTIMALDGRWQEARAIAAASKAPGTYILRRQLTQAIAPIARLMGNTDEAWGCILALLPDGADAEPGSAVLLDAVMLQQIATHICLDAGNSDDAERWLRSNDRWLHWSGCRLGRAENELAWGRFHTAAGHLVKASLHAERAVTFATSPRQPLSLLRAQRLRGTLAMQRGERTDAEKDLRASLELAITCGLPHERAESLLALAELQRTSDPAAASTLARESLDIAIRLPAPALIAYANALLEQFHSTGEASNRPAGLTNRELDVLRLVASGMTDAEIGNRLSISPRTVGQHLRSIYSKLDVRSRTEATRFAMEHDIG